MSYIITSIIVLCLCNFACTTSTKHQHHQVQRTRNSDYERQEKAVQEQESSNVFSDMYDLLVKFFGMFSKPISNFFNGIWKFITFFPKFFLQVMNLTGSVFRTLFQMIVKGGYSWLKVQDIIVDFIRDFQKELLEALRVNFFPEVPTPYKS